MIIDCKCENIKHENNRCNRTATLLCSICDLAMCKPCAKKHHVHSDAPMKAMEFAR